MDVSVLIQKYIELTLHLKHTLLSFFHSKTVSKYLITTGLNKDGYLTTSEIVDLTIKGGNQCNNWPDIPWTSYTSTTLFNTSTAGLIGNTPMICGLYGCYSLDKYKQPLLVHLPPNRNSAAGIVLNSTTLWITGGYIQILNKLASTEFVTTTGTLEGPDMPIDLMEHVIVAINSTCSMVIGGWSDEYRQHYTDAGYTALTFYYDHAKDIWINGPGLIKERDRHAAGFVIDGYTNDKYLIVTGGNQDGFLDSTEMLQENVWTQGKIKKN